MDGSRKFFALFCGLAIVFSAELAHAQGLGSDLQNFMTPAAGGMAGVSVALPQDAPAALFGNPATMTQFKGIQFTFGGAWIEGYPTIDNDGSLNGGTPFNVTSRTEGFVAPETAVLQNFQLCGFDGTAGIGLNSLSGMGAEYRGRAPGTILNNFSSQYLVLGLTAGAGVEVTERASVGATVTLGTAFEQLGFTGPLVSSAMVNDYALRATLGADYELTDYTTLGAFWQSPMRFQFNDAVRFNGVYDDLEIGQPGTVGLGLANNRLMDGKLLVAFDVYYKDWEGVPLWRDVLVDQWAFAIGTQYTLDSYKLRLGYEYNTNPINHNVGANLDGFPILQQNVQLFQAAAASFVNQNRITAGIGREFGPNLDVDLFVGGMFKSANNFGPDTRTSLAIWYAGLGITWKFDNTPPSAACQACQP